MHLKSTKKLRFQATKVGKSFTSERLTSYSGLTVINDYVNHLGIFNELNCALYTIKKNATMLCMKHARKQLKAGKEYLNRK